MQNVYRSIIFIWMACIFIGIASCNNIIRSKADSESPSWWYEGWAASPDVGRPNQENSKPLAKKDFLYISVIIPVASPSRESCKQLAQKAVPGVEMTKFIADAMSSAFPDVSCHARGNAFPSLTMGKVVDCCIHTNESPSCSSRSIQMAANTCECIVYFQYPGGQKALQHELEENPRLQEMIECTRY